MDPGKTNVPRVDTLVRRSHSCMLLATVISLRACPCRHSAVQFLFVVGLFILILSVPPRAVSVNVRTLEACLYTRYVTFWSTTRITRADNKRGSRRSVLRVLNRVSAYRACAISIVCSFRLHHRLLQPASHLRGTGRDSHVTWTVEWRAAGGSRWQGCEHVEPAARLVAAGAHAARAQPAARRAGRPAGIRQGKLLYRWLAFPDVVC